MVNYKVVADQLAEIGKFADDPRKLTVAGFAIFFAEKFQREDPKFDPFLFFEQAGLDDETANWAFKYL